MTANGPGDRRAPRLVGCACQLASVVLDPSLGCVTKNRVSAAVGRWRAAEKKGSGRHLFESKLPRPRAGVRTRRHACLGILTDPYMPVVSSSAGGGRSRGGTAVTDRLAADEVRRSPENRRRQFLPCDMTLAGSCSVDKGDVVQPIVGAVPHLIRDERAPW